MSPTARAPSPPRRSPSPPRVRHRTDLREARAALAGRRRRGRLPDDGYVSKTITIVQGIGEAGYTTVYIRKRNPSIDSDTPDEYNSFVAISTRCMHLGCPVSYKPAAQRFICPCHGGVYDFEGKVSGGPPVRPLDRFYTRVVGGPRADRPALLRQPRAAPLLPARPGEPLDGIGQYAYRRAPRSARSRARRRCPSSSSPSSRARRPAPCPAPWSRAAPARRDERQGRPGGRRRRGGHRRRRLLDERTSLSGAGALDVFRKVPKGTKLVLHAGLGDDVRLPQPGDDRRVPGDVLRPVADPRVRVDPVHHNEAFLGEFVRGMHKWGSTVMVILVFLHMARTFFFGAYKYPRELNWGHRRRAADPHDAGCRSRATCSRSTSAPTGRRSSA